MAAAAGPPSDTSFSTPGYYNPLGNTGQDPSASVSAPPSDLSLLPIFNVEHVPLQFDNAADFVAAQVANNVMVLALATGALLRIDLGNAADIDCKLRRMWKC